MFRVNSDGTSDILAEFRDTPVYIHSFSVTENYVILMLFPQVLNAISILLNNSFIGGLSFNHKMSTKIYVISRKEKKIAAVYEADPFFCFHTINAFEDPRADEINIDLCRYANGNVVHEFYIRKMATKSAQFFSEVKAYRFTLGRFSNALGEYSLHTKTFPRASARTISVAQIELPSISPTYRLKPYRYIYGVSQNPDFGDHLFNALVKIDISTGEEIYWAIPQLVCGEPIFVKDPDGDTEDAGSLLSVVLDATAKKSFLAVIDARSMKEVARATVPQPVPLGFHGKHIA